MKRRLVLSALTGLLISGIGATTPTTAAGAARGDRPATAASVQIVLSFDRTRGELPEGVAADAAGTVYVGLAPLGTVLRRTPDGTVAPLADLDVGDGVLLGLTTAGDGALYAALASFREATHGIWRIEPDGTARRFAAMPVTSTPNDLALLDDGGLAVTDSARGAVYRITPTGGPMYG